MLGQTGRKLEAVDANQKALALSPQDEIFGFEITIAERTQTDAERLVKSGSYQYLRSCLIKRWNVLASFHTYPHMIKPLNIK